MVDMRMDNNHLRSSGIQKRSASYTEHVLCTLAVEM